jgi:hypothetical protein
MPTSVLINTDQNPRSLAECFGAVLGQTRRPDGVVVAHNDRRTETAGAGRAGAVARARHHSRWDAARPALAEAMPQLNPRAELRSFAKQFRQMRGDPRQAAFPIPDFLPGGGA